MSPGESYDIPPPIENWQSSEWTLHFQCSQWELIWDSQLIGRYKEMSVWHQVTLPQIDCLGKTVPVMRVSTHIYGVSKEIDGKTFIFWVNLGMWPLKSIVVKKTALFWGFQQTFMGFLRR